MGNDSSVLLMLPSATGAEELRQSLVGRGLLCTTETNPAAAVAACLRDAPDLLVLGTPGALTELRVDPQAAVIPVALLVPEANETSLSEALARGAIDVIRADDPPDRIAERIHELLRHLRFRVDEMTGAAAGPGAPDVEELCAAVRNEPGGAILSVEAPGSKPERLALVPGRIEAAPIADLLLRGAHTSRHARFRLQIGDGRRLGLLDLGVRVDWRAPETVADDRETRVVVVGRDAAAQIAMTEKLGGAELSASGVTPDAEGYGWCVSSRPDAIVGDARIVPTDGWNFFRALRGDLLMRWVPLQLVSSWTETAGLSALHAKIYEAIAPLSEMRRRLQHGAEVSGRIELVGPAALLRAVAQSLPSSRIVVTDGQSAFRVELVGGRPAHVRRVGPDKNEDDGILALAQMMTMDAGRFQVRAAFGDRGQGNLPTSLEESLVAVREILKSVFGPGLLSSGPVAPDGVSCERTAIEQFARMAPERFGQLLDDIRHGEPLERLLGRSGLEGAEVRRLLVDLFRFGALRPMAYSSANDHPEAASTLAELVRWRAREGTMPRTGEATDAGSSARGSGPRKLSDRIRAVRLGVGSSPPPTTESDASDAAVLGRVLTKTPERPRSAPPPLPAKKSPPPETPLVMVVAAASDEEVVDLPKLKSRPPSRWTAPGTQQATPAPASTPSVSPGGSGPRRTAPPPLPAVTLADEPPPEEWSTPPPAPAVASPEVVTVDLASEPAQPGSNGPGGLGMAGGTAPAPPSAVASSESGDPADLVETRERPVAPHAIEALVQPPAPPPEQTSVAVLSEEPLPPATAAGEPEGAGTADARAAASVESPKSADRRVGAATGTPALRTRTGAQSRWLAPIVVLAMIGTALAVYLLTVKVERPAALRAVPVVESGNPRLALQPPTPLPPSQPQPPAASPPQTASPQPPAAPAPEAPSPATYQTADQARLAGDLLGAETLYRQVLAGDPNEPHAHAGLAEILLARGELDASRREAELAIRARPRRADYHALAGRIAERRGLALDAAAHYQRAAQLDPGDAASRRAAQRLGATTSRPAPPSPATHANPYESPEERPAPRRPGGQNSAPIVVPNVDLPSPDLGF